MKTYLTLKDEDGIIRPRAEIWADDEHGIDASKKYQEKNPAFSIIRITIVEIETIIKPIKSV